MQSKDRTRVKGFIAVHIGAGYHSPINDKKNRILMRDALLAGSEHAKQFPNDPVSTLESIIRVLESSPLTNTVSHETVLYLCKGLGSNLNINGEVECDASIMSTPVESKSVFAGIALAKTMHPITTAKRLLDTNVFCGGRVKPLLVAGMDGLNKFISEEERGECITEEQEARYKRMMKEVDNSLKRKREKDATEKTEIDKLNDTVGAIYVSSSGHHVAGVSSGGIWLKHPGRIGHAAHYGAGVWTSSNSAVSCTGTGEVMIEAAFARRIAQCEGPEDIDSAMHDAVDQAEQSEIYNNDEETERSVGFIAWMNDGFWFGFNTESMGVGYLSLTDNIPHTLIHRATKQFVIQGIHIK